MSDLADLQVGHTKVIESLKGVGREMKRLGQAMGRFGRLGGRRYRRYRKRMDRLRKLRAARPPHRHVRKPGNVR